MGLHSVGLVYSQPRTKQESDELTISSLKMESYSWSHSAATASTPVQIFFVGSNPEELNVTLWDRSCQCTSWRATWAAVRETSEIQKQPKDVEKQNCSLPSMPTASFTQKEVQDICVSLVARQGKDVP